MATTYDEDGKKKVTENKNRGLVANSSSRRSDYSTLKKPDLQPNAHKAGYKWDPLMQIWYKPIRGV